MIENFRVYLPKSKREVKIQISSPRHKDNIIFDTVYFLDGQNAFSDYVSAFGRSIRATKHIYMAAKNMGKRIIGVAGDHIKIEDGKVYLNGEELNEPYLREGIITDGGTFNEVTVPEGCVFVMGDNRPHSTDSRSFGCIPVNKIESKVWIRFWPFNKFGKV